MFAKSIIIHTCFQVTVTLKKSVEFDNMKIETSKTSIVSIDASRIVMVRSELNLMDTQSLATHYFIKIHFDKC